MEEKQEDQHPDFEQCTTHARVYKQGNPDNAATAVDEGYASKFYYCQMNVKDSSDSIPGKFTIVNVVLCALDEAQVPFTDTLTTHAVDIKKGETQCVPDNFFEDGDEMTVYFQVQSTPKGEWTHLVNIKFGEDEEYSSKTFFKISETEIAAVIADPFDSAGQPRQRYSAFSLNLESGKLLVDNINAESNENVGYGSDHLRFMITGTLSAENGSFSEINQMSGIYGMKSSGFATITGNPTDGFRTAAYSSTLSQDNDTFEYGEAKIECLIASGECSSEAITLTKTQAAAWLLTNSEEGDKAMSWVLDLEAPVDFSSVDPAQPDFW